MDYKKCYIKGIFLKDILDHYRNIFYEYFETEIWIVLRIYLVTLSGLFIREEYF